MRGRAHPAARGAICLLLAALQIWPALALASEAPAVEQARALIEEGEFERSLKAIDGALSNPSLDEGSAAILYELQGTAWLYLGRDDRAKASFEKLLRIAPDYQLAKGSSAKARNLLDGVRTKLAAQPKRVAIEHMPPGSAVAGQPVELRASIRDLPQGATPKAFWRRRGVAKYGSSPLTSDGPNGWTVQIPGFEIPEGLQATAVEYYLEVVSAEGKRLGSVGTPERPMSIPVAPANSGTPAAPPAEATSEAWYQKWWVWTIAGGLAVGAGAAVAYPLLKEKRADVPITITVQQ